MDKEMILEDGEGMAVSIGSVSVGTAPTGNVVPGGQGMGVNPSKTKKVKKRKRQNIFTRLNNG